ncbi:MAG: hypothetical protein AUJ57_00885 [Zetaproteobacteria bacterium CG1_02_53_45]|nr:MAG: hypothetical protein AUJ57_00885 [Zetaproteobacteria bacterium CG1_02_53_45]
MDIFETILRRRGRPAKNPVSEPQEERTDHITGTDRDYAPLLEDGDIALKIWLPELMGTMLDETCSLLNTTRSDLIRQTLFTYLYGRYDWLGMYENNEKQYQLNQPDLYSIHEPKEPNIMADMGKNTEDLKVWVPRKMKEDIQKMADQAGLSASETIREIIISTMIGTHTCQQEINYSRPASKSLKLMKTNKCGMGSSLL